MQRQTPHYKRSNSLVYHLSKSYYVQIFLSPIGEAFETGLIHDHKYLAILDPKASSIIPFRLDENGTLETPQLHKIYEISAEQYNKLALGRIVNYAQALGVLDKLPGMKVHNWAIEARAVLDEITKLENDAN